MTHPTLQSILESFDENFRHSRFCGEQKVDASCVCDYDDFKSFLEHAMREAVEAVMVEEGCCNDCFIPSHDTLRGPDYMIADAMPEGCRGEECPCHAARQAMLTKRAAFFGEKV